LMLCYLLKKITIICKFHHETKNKVLQKYLTIPKRLSGLFNESFLILDDVSIPQRCKNADLIYCVLLLLI
jgi:hypothetical protein